MTVRWNPPPAAGFCAGQAMIAAAIQRAGLLPGARRLVLAAVRCWRTARDDGAPVQQRLYTMLSTHDYGMLAPVFDSLMTLGEAALGRKIAVGGAILSDDERLLIGLLEGDKPGRAAIARSEGMAAALGCAIRSTRIMMALVMGRSGERPHEYPAAAHAA